MAAVGVQATKNKLKSPAVIVGFMIAAMAISKLLGMLRSVLLASSYGITEKATAFSAASRIPVSVFDIIFGSAILGCFIPIYNGFKKEESDNNPEGDKFACVYLNFLLLVTGVLSVAGILFGKQILDIIQPGMLPETAALALKLLRIMFPLIILAAASYTLVGILQSKGEFIVPAFISAVSNICIILYFIFLDGVFDITGLACAYTVSWIVQLFTLIIPLKKKGFSYQLLFDFKSPDFIKALKMTPLVIMGSWLAPVCMLFGMRFAAVTGAEGAVPSFEYAINIFTVITVITTYGVCNYIFPKMSREWGNNDNERFHSTVRNGLSSSLMIIIPIAAAVAVLSKEIISVIYLRGSFDVVAAEQVSTVLFALVPGMLGFTLVEVMSRVLYAMKNPKLAALSVFSGIVCNIVLLYFLIKPGQESFFTLGLCYSAGILFAGLLMTIICIYKMKGFICIHFIYNLIKIILSGAISYIAMRFLYGFLGIDAFTAGFLKNVIYSFAVVFAGFAVYLLSCILLKENSIYSLIKDKFIKRKVKD